MYQWTHEDIEKARNDFRVFLFIVWKSIGLPEPTPLQYDMANSLQHPQSDRMILQAFRGAAKSFITCAFAVWELWKKPLLKILIVSASKDRADANAIFIKQIIYTIPFLEDMKARNDQRNSQNIFDVGTCTQPDSSPSVKTVGISGQMTGTRADRLIADDVEVQNNSLTQKQREQLGETVKEFDSILKPKGRVIYLGTPQNEMSLYNALQERGYSCIIYPVRYPRSMKERDFYGKRLAPSLAEVFDGDPEKWLGIPTEPSAGRFPEEELQKRELSNGAATFSLQFMLNTDLSDSEKYPLHLQDLIVTDLDLTKTSLTWDWATNEKWEDLESVGLRGDFYYKPLNRSIETVPYMGSILVIDPSGRGKDETAYVVLKYLNGYLFLMEAGGYRDGYSPTTLRNLATIAKTHKVQKIIYEANYGDGMFGQLLFPILQEVHPLCPIEEVKHSTQKERRIIDTLEPVMMSHKLIVHRQVIKDDIEVAKRNKNYSLFYQMTRLTNERGSLNQDDRLDALAIGVNHWVEYMHRDDKKGIQEHNQKEFERMLSMEFKLIPNQEDENNWEGKTIHGGKK